MMKLVRLSETKCNGTYKTVARITGAQERQAGNGKSYVIVDYSDDKMADQAKVWDCTLETFPFKEDDFIVFFLKVEEYEGNRSPVIMKKNGDEEWRHLDEVADGVKGTDLIRKAATDPEKIYGGFMKQVDNFKNKGLASVVKKIYEDNKELLIAFPAAQKIHHAYYGGLLEHTYEMFLDAKNIAKKYPELDVEMLLAGILLHDVGKLKEFDCNPATGTVKDYTPEGKLMGHLVLGQNMLIEAYNSFEEKPLTEGQFLHLKHMVLSHHEKAEWGAATEPKTLESTIIARVDKMSADAAQFRDYETDLAENESTTQKCFGLGVRVFKPERFVPEEPDVESDTKADAKPAEVEKKAEPEKAKSKKAS